MARGFQIAAFVGYLVSTVALTCFRQDKKVPVNYILLSIFTLSMTWIVGAQCLMNDPIVVLEAASLTLSVTVAITLYAMTTKQDFTIYGPVLMIVSFVFTTAGLLFFMFGYNPGLIWSVFGVLLFSAYLLFNTQMIMGGDKKRYQYDEDSYILAAISLYIDILNIFMYLLQILKDK